MTLSCNNPFTKRNYGPGIYVNEVNIVDVEDISGEILPFMDEPVDIGLRMTLDVGKDFQPQFIIAGNFRRDVTGEVTGWGNAFVVQDALYKLGYSGNLDENNHIPSEVLQSLIGKKFLRLSYMSGSKGNGKARYTDWNCIATLDEGAESLVRRFHRSLRKGYPRNYHPEVVDGFQPKEDTVPEAETDES